MSTTIPATVRAAVADPKYASTTALETAVGYVDVLDDDAYSAVFEEHARRTDPMYETPSYDL